MTNLPILADQKDNNYDLILAIINYLIKKVYNKLIKVKINIINFVKVIINMVI